MNAQEALENLKIYHNYFKTRVSYKENLEIIESALDQLEELEKENRKLKKEKQSLSHLYGKTKLILKIIKEYPNVASFMMWALHNERVEKHTYKHIVEFCKNHNSKIPTESEFNLIKEYLK